MSLHSDYVSHGVGQYFLTVLTYYLCLVCGCHCLSFPPCSQKTDTKLHHLCNYHQTATFCFLQLIRLPLLFLLLLVSSNLDIIVYCCPSKVINISNKFGWTFHSYIFYRLSHYRSWGGAYLSILGRRWGIPWTSRQFIADI